MTKDLRYKIVRRLLAATVVGVVLVAMSTAAFFREFHPSHVVGFVVVLQAFSAANYLEFSGKQKNSRLKFQHVDVNVLAGLFVMPILQVLSYVLSVVTLTPFNAESISVINAIGVVSCLFFMVCHHLSIRYFLKEIHEKPQIWKGQREEERQKAAQRERRLTGQNSTATTWLAQTVNKRRYTLR